MGILTKIVRNLKKGSLISAGSKALSNRFKKWRKSSNLFYRRDFKRILTKELEKEFPPIDHNHLKTGNYFIDKRLPLNSDSVVYSLGILEDTRFDEAIATKYKCDVYMFDPTPLTVKFMAGQSNPHFKYFPIGVWTENTNLKFYLPSLDGSASTVNVMGDKYFEAKCKTVDTIMNEFGHQHINVFKADIEGAALPVIEQIIDKGIFPDQIIAEFERPEGDIKQTIDFFQRLLSLTEKCRELGYKEYLLPRKHAKYFSLEILYSRLHKPD